MTLKRRYSSIVIIVELHMVYLQTVSSVNTRVIEILRNGREMKILSSLLLLRPRWASKGLHTTGR